MSRLFRPLSLPNRLAKLTVSSPYQKQHDIVHLAKTGTMKSFLSSIKYHCTAINRFIHYQEGETVVGQTWETLPIPHEAMIHCLTLRPGLKSDYQSIELSQSDTDPFETLTAAVNSCSKYY